MNAALTHTQTQVSNALKFARQKMSKRLQMVGVECEV